MGEGDRGDITHTYVRIFPSTQEGGHWAHSGDKSGPCGKSLLGEGKELRRPLTQPGGVGAVFKDG